MTTASAIRLYCADTSSARAPSTCRTRAGSGSEQAPDPGYRPAEVAESAERHQAYRPTFRRLRIDIVKMPELGRISKVAEQRQTAPPLRLGILRARRGCGPKRLVKKGRRRQACRRGG